MLVSRTYARCEYAIGSEPQTEWINDILNDILSDAFRETWNGVIFPPVLDANSTNREKQLLPIWRALKRVLLTPRDLGLGTCTIPRPRISQFREILASYAFAIENGGHVAAKWEPHEQLGDFSDAKVKA